MHSGKCTIYIVCPGPIDLPKEAQNKCRVKNKVHSTTEQINVWCQTHSFSIYFKAFKVSKNLKSTKTLNSVNGRK